MRFISRFINHREEIDTEFFDPYYSLLLDDLKQSQDELDRAYCNLSNALEPDIIDSCIYQVNAAQLRHKFLLGQVKKQSKFTGKEVLHIV